MVGVVLEEPQCDRARPYVQAPAEVAGRGRRAQHGEGVEGSYLGVVRVLLVQPLHRLHVTHSTMDVITVAPEDLDRVEEAFFAIGGCLRQPFRTGGSQPLERLARQRRVHRGIQRMVVRQ